MTSPSAEIVNNLMSQPTWIIGDTKTFQHLRLYEPELIEKEKLGGGNILTIIGLFAVINYFSKVYKILQSGKLPKENPYGKGNYFTEKEAFITLANDFPNSIIEDKQDEITLNKLWQTFRCDLSHIAQIKLGNRVLVLVGDQKNIPKDIVQKFVKNNSTKPFRLINDDGFVCMVDKLITDVESMLDWIITDIDTRFPKANIELTNNWIRCRTVV